MLLGNTGAKQAAASPSSEQSGWKGGPCQHERVSSFLKLLLLSHHSFPPSNVLGGPGAGWREVRV